MIRWVEIIGAYANGAPLVCIVFANFLHKCGIRTPSLVKYVQKVDYMTDAD